MYYRLSFLIILFLSASLSAQIKPNATIYNPDANAAADIDKALAQASKEHKHVLLQIGGNWCPWCIKLHSLFSTDPTIDSLLKADYVFVLVNYSKENRNLSLMRKYGFPQRFGFPVLVVLDANGLRLHTQDSGLLEGGKQHDPQKVLTFLKAWTSKALDPETYKE
jgi:thiol:disulfide interchange protein